MTAMYDELVKRLRNRRICIQQLGTLNDYPLLGEAADAIEDLEFACNRYEKDYKDLCDYLPKWIPVTERLPDVFKHVLVNIPGMTPHPTVQEAFREKNGMWYSNGFRYGADEITHWMPLPEPPESEESK